MSSKSTIEEYLEARGIVYQPIDHPPTSTLQQAADACGVDPNLMLRAITLKEGNYRVIVLLPLPRLLNFTALQQLTGRRLEPITQAERHPLFPDCEPDTTPPLGAPYGLETVIETSIFTLGDIYLEPGHKDRLLRMHSSSLQILQPDALCGRFSQPVDHLHSTDMEPEGSHIPHPHLLERLH